MNVHWKGNFVSFTFEREREGEHSFIIVTFCVLLYLSLKSNYDFD